MPRTIHPDLLDCLRRPNPYVEYRVEVTEPDAVRVIRRTDEFLGTPPLVGAMVPANSLSTNARGSLILSPTTTAFQSFAGEQSFYDLNGENPQRRIKGAAWTMDAAFTRATLKSVTARVQRAGIFNFNLDFELQIFRVTKTPGFKEKFVEGTQQVQATAFTDYSFSPLLNPAPVIKAGSIIWDGANKSTLSFDLSNYALILENTPSRAAAPDQVGELPRYYFVVRVLNNPAGTGHFRWLLDTASARTIAGKGTFQRVFWARDNDQQQWTENLLNDVPAFAINIETYPASGQAIYAIDVGKVPDTARGSIGRAVFERFLPPGTDGTIELSTAGAAGPWTVIKHGDAIAVAQQNYHIRVTLYSDATSRATPTVAALGAEWRIPVDVSVESTPQLPTREIALPWPKASIPEGKLVIARTGVRDYLDTAGIIGSTQPTTKLECDIYLASRHPSVTRDKWLHLERLNVTNRIPGPTSETLTLLSYAAKLKRKLPQKMESLNTVHTVTASTVNQVTVSPALVGATAGGNEYDAKGYYMRVRSTSSADVKPGAVNVISGNTGVDKLDFVPPLTVALAIGDVVEVHSGVFATQPISWTDADPADVWYELLTTWAGIPPERVGMGNLPRGGRPPRVTDIAPGDAATQAKLKITNKLSEIESADELLDQVSAIVGGVTLEMPGGQICFVQIFPLRDALGNVTVPLPPVVKTFDQRDYGASLQTPPGLEKRATVMAANYGVPLTAAAPETYPKQTTVTVDNDALLWLTQQDLEDFGSAELPDKIARWLYNTSDSGLYLASSLTATYVRALSTGLRVFPFGSTEKNPELMPGDSVAIVTDQYTDYEPASRTPLRGPLVVRGVLVSVGNEGKQLALFVPGLMDNVQSAIGGAAGELIGLGPPLDPPILSGFFLPSGELVVSSQGAPGTAEQRIAVGTVEPTDAFTRAATPIPGQSQAGLATGLIIPAGGSAWIKAFAYNAYGRESLVARVQVAREGSGTADPPTAFIVPLDTEIDDTVWYLGFEVVAGSGGGGANLTYEVRQKIGYAAETVIDSGDENDLPVVLGITRHPRSDKAIRFVVTDAATGLTGVERINIPASRPEVDDTGLQFTTGVKESGGKVVNRLLAKPLAADADTLDSVTDGLSHGKTLLTALTSGKVDLAKVGVVGQSIELIRNPNFESGNRDWSIPGNWDIVNDPANAYDGNWVATYNSVAASALRNALYIPVQPGDIVLARAMVRRVSGTGSGYVRVNWQNAAHAEIGNDNEITVTSSAWTTSKVVAVAPADAAYARIEAVADNGFFYFDGFYAEVIVGFTSTTGALVTTATESGGKAANRLLAKALAADVDSLDGLPEGTSYKRITTNAVTGGTIDFNKSGFSNKSGSFIARSSGDGTGLDNVVGQLANTGHATGTFQESGGKVINRLYAKALAGDADNADSLTAGVSKRVTSLNEASGGGRGFNALDSASLLVRSRGTDDGYGFAPTVDLTGSRLNTGVTDYGSRTVQRLLAKTLIADPDTFDAVVDGTTYKRVLGVSSGMVTNSSVGGGALETTKLAAGSFKNVADNTGFESGLLGWSPNLAINDGNARSGSYAAKFATIGPALAMRNLQLFPVEPGEAIYIEAWFKTTGGGNGSGYVRISWLDIGGVEFSTGDSGAVSPSASYIKASARVVAPAGSAGARVEIVILSNTVGSWYVDDVKCVRAVQNEITHDVGASKLGANAIDVGLLTTIQESGGAAVNRLLAKPLAADPNTYDSVADGVTYKRVLGVSSGQVGTTGMQDASVTPVKALPRMRCKVYHSGSQSIANNTNVVVGWDAESWDSGTLHDNSTNNSRITVPAGGNTGVWHLRAQICWAASTPGTGVRRTIIKKNGTTWLANTQYAAIPGGALITIVECNADDDTPAVGDYYEVEVVQNSGAALNLLGSGSPDNSQFTALHMW